MNTNELTLSLQDDGTWHVFIEGELTYYNLDDLEVSTLIQEFRLSALYGD